MTTNRTTIFRSTRKISYIINSVFKKKLDKKWKRLYVHFITVNNFLK